MGIETRISRISAYDERELYVTDKQRSFMIKQDYSTIELHFSDKTDPVETRAFIVSDLERYLRQRGFPDAKFVRKEEASLVGIAEIGYLLRSTSTNPVSQEEDAVAVSHSSPYYPGMKFRFRQFKPSFMKRLFGPKNTENEFYDEIRDYLQLLVTGVAREKVREMMPAYVAGVA